MHKEIYAPFEIEHGFDLQDKLLSISQWKQQFGRYVQRDAEPRRVVIAKNGGHEVKLFDVSQTKLILRTYAQWLNFNRRVLSDAQPRELVTDRQGHTLHLYSLEQTEPVE